MTKRMQELKRRAQELEVQVKCYFQFASPNDILELNVIGWVGFVLSFFFVKITRS